MDSQGLDPDPNRDLNKDLDKYPGPDLHLVHKIEEKGGPGGPIGTKEKKELQVEGINHRVVLNLILKKVLPPVHHPQGQGTNSILYSYPKFGFYIRSQK